jgi:hypothetical protein
LIRDTGKSASLSKTGTHCFTVLFGFFPSLSASNKLVALVSVQAEVAVAAPSDWNEKRHITMSQICDPSHAAGNQDKLVQVIIEKMIKQ